MTAAPAPPREADFEGEALLTDGSAIRLRAMRSDDGKRFAAMMARCSEQSLYYRFLSPPSTEWAEKQLDYFTHIDHDKRMAIVAVDDVDGDERIVADGRWDILADDPSSAEVAFLVEDDYQGKGLGTTILAELAALAPAHGIRFFEASVLADNRPMLDVFHKTGYRVTHEIEAGVYHIIFPIRPTAASLEAETARESATLAATITSVLEPTRVAIVGASRDPRSIGSQMLRNVVRSNFTGVVLPVNPNTLSVASVLAVPEIEDLPDDVDLGVVALGSPNVLDATEALGRKGVKTVLVVAEDVGGGGTDSLAGDDELVELCRRYGMRMIGPGSLGLINTDPRLRLQLVAGEWQTSPGVVGVAAHGGSLGVGILEYLERLNIGVSQFISLGDREDVSSSDLLAYWETQEATRVVLLYVESFWSPTRFARIARRVGRVKPIAAVLTGGDANAPGRYALRSQCGVVEAHTLEELVDVAAVLSTQPLPRGRRVAIVTNSAGTGRLVAEVCREGGLEMADLGEATAATAEELGIAPENPLRIPFRSEAAVDFGRVLRAVAADDGVDCVLVIFVPTETSDSEDVAREVVRAAQRARDKAFAASILAAQGTPPFLRRRSVAVPSFVFPEAAARALALAATYASWRARPQGEYVEFDDIDIDKMLATIDKTPEGHVDGDGAGAILLGVGLEAGSIDAEPFVVHLEEYEGFGPMMGLGRGVDPTLIRHDAFRIVPLTDIDAQELVADVVAGLPARAEVDTDALVDVVLRLAQLIDSQSRLHAGDVVVHSGGEGAGTGVASATFEIG